MNPIYISEKDREIILQKARSLPPSHWLPKSHTEDQKKYWDKLKFIYSSLFHELAAFFSGRETTLMDYPPEWKGCIEREVRRTIDTYTLIRNGWFVIKTSAQQLYERDLCPNDRKAVKTILDANSPGELLAAILESECKRSFGVCLGYRELRPKHMYKLAVEAEKLLNLRDLNKSFDHSLSEDQVKFTNQVLAKMQKLAKLSRTGQATVLNLCLSFCDFYLEKNEDENLKVSLSRYIEGCRSDLLQGMSDLHPEKRNKNSCWNKGQLNKT